LYVFVDTNGKIIAAVAADHPGVVLTRIPEGTTPLYLDDNQYADVWNNLGEYTIQNGVPVHTPIPDSVKLANAQKAKLEELYAGLQATLAAGFTSKTTGHTYKTDDKARQNFMEALKWLELNPSATSILFFTLDAGWVSHTPTQLQQAFVEGGMWKQAQYNQYAALEAQVKAATTVDAVNAIHWTPATY
jgi:hypothetical protein